MVFVPAWPPPKDGLLLKVAAQKVANVLLPDQRFSPHRRWCRPLLDTLNSDKPSSTTGVIQRAFRFQRSQRLLNASDYKNVFDKNDFRASHKKILMLARLNKTASARLGLVFGKKNIPRSVDRNRLKRISREQFRLRNETLTGLDVIILARDGLAELTNDAYAKLILKLIKDITQQQAQK